MKKNWNDFKENTAYIPKDQKQLELLASVVYYMRDSVTITTPDLDKPGPKIVYVNPAFTELTGYLPQEVIGKTPRILQGPKTDRRVLDHLRETLAKGGVFYGQAINYRKDGSEYYLDWHIEPIYDEKGNTVYYLGIQRDVTEKKKAEEALAQKNSALREILEQIEIEKKNIKDDVVKNIEELAIPIIQKLKKKGTPADRKQLDLLKRNLEDLTSSFGKKISDRHLKLSPREIEICNMVRNGLSNKEIADLLHTSLKTVEVHRNHIRKKLGILNKGINLTSYLQKT